MLYHVSPVAGIKTLEPHLSSHGKAYVYAIADRSVGLVFGARCDDFDFCVNTEDDGVTELVECYPGALERVYRGQACTVYTVDETDFQQGKTGWNPELVCDHSVPVLGEESVPDLYTALLAEEAQGRLRIQRYQANPDYRQRIARHVVDRIIRFGVDVDTIAARDERFSTHFAALVDALRKVMDGSLLA